jgi:hypothetical protein
MMPALLTFVGLAGCGGSGAQSLPSPTARLAQTTPSPSVPVPHTTATPAASAEFKAFVSTLCNAFTARDASTVSSSLPYYQYNSGVRYGWLGDGEGQTADPSILQTWLAPGTVRCRYFTPDLRGHGTLLTDGWPLRGGWSLVEMDTYGGAWKINDFTFGGHAALWQAIQQAYPSPELYRG